ncbi:MAG: nicotinamide-nucleotide amidohydrolase family protein [Candidatus Omnitrophica bacterium]|nr:nicotinamide-nucleotide amidohydrolase family protein [Candidatus Omnitrophota bacterium]
MITAKTLAQKLILKRKTLATAESCTGGLVAHTLTNIPGSSDFFMAGIVSYANTSKTQLLGVSPLLIKKHGAVSAVVAKAMAEGVRKRIKTDFGIGITGIAGPTGGTPKKPVGLVFIAVAASPRTVVKKFIFKGTRLQVKQKAVQKTFFILNNFL